MYTHRRWYYLCTHNTHIFSNGTLKSWEMHRMSRQFPTRTIRLNYEAPTSTLWRCHATENPNRQKPPILSCAVCIHSARFTHLRMLWRADGLIPIGFSPLTPSLFSPFFKWSLSFLSLQVYRRTRFLLLLLPCLRLFTPKELLVLKDEK